jgi:hypothetical protein
VGGNAIQINKTSLLHLVVWVGEKFFLPWFSKEQKMTYWRTTNFVAPSLYFSFMNQYSLGRGFLFPIMLVPRYKLYLYHTPIKPNLLGFSGNWCICMLVAWPCVQEARIIWYHSLAPLIKLYQYEIVVSRWFLSV